MNRAPPQCNGEFNTSSASVLIPDGLNISTLNFILHLNSLETTVVHSVHGIHTEPTIFCGPGICYIQVDEQQHVEMAVSN